MELWKPIPGYPDYEASDLGRIKSLKLGRVRILVPLRTTKGYYRVGLYRDDSQFITMIHRIIYSTFVRPLQKEELIDHIDRDKSNNRLENLRIATNSQNRANSFVNKGKKLPKGVKFWKGIYRADITSNNKRYYLGQYATAEEAAIVYDAKARELFGEFAHSSTTGSVLTLLDVKPTSLRSRKYPLGVAKCSGNNSNRYYAQIRHNLKTIYLGCYTTAELAGEAYVRKYEEIHGERPCLL